MKPAIPELPYRHNVKPGLGFEIFTLQSLVERARRLGYPIESPQRPDFHTIYLGTRGRGTHVVDFTPVPGQIGRHPLLTLLEAVHYTGEEAKIPSRTYIFATDWEPTPFRRFSQQVQTDGGWAHHESKASHFVMADQPEQTAQILLGLAE